MLHVHYGLVENSAPCHLLQDPKLLEQPVSGTLVMGAEGKRAQEALELAGNNSHLEVTHICSQQVGQNYSHVLPNYQDARKWKPAACLEGRELEIFGKQN